jgi:hypothetical protein
LCGADLSDDSLGTKQDKAMTQEQFNRVVEAIVEGKYSWACVLILRFAGYNPLHYIPYRTYKRLLKENGNTARKTLRESLSESVDQNLTEIDAQPLSVALSRAAS